MSHPASRRISAMTATSRSRGRTVRTGAMIGANHAERLHVGVAGFDITPRFHPRCGAWGSTPSMTALDAPLLSRCLALRQTDQLVLWFGSDLFGASEKVTQSCRDEVARALGLSRAQVIWSTSQTHSSGPLPATLLIDGNAQDRASADLAFVRAEHSRLIGLYAEAGRRAIDQLQPAQVKVARGFCDSVSYNTRLPMPGGGVKFSRHHAEGLQSGKFFDPTISLVQFEALDGRPLGLVFNFCCHPATMINGDAISPDWVGTARAVIEEAIDGAPAMFLQGFCGDVNCYHLLGTVAQARKTGQRLGRAAVDALDSLAPVRGEPLLSEWTSVELECQPMPDYVSLERRIALREAFIREVGEDPTTTWVDGINLPEKFGPEVRIAEMHAQIAYFREALRRLAAGDSPRTALPLAMGALRIGDVAAVLAPGELFTRIGEDIRQRSPFAHTLVGGDTNGLFGYVGTDDEIDRRGYETDTFWTITENYDGFRLPPAKGSAGRITTAGVALLRELAGRPAPA